MKLLLDINCDFRYCQVIVICFISLEIWKFLVKFFLSKRGVKLKLWIIYKLLEFLKCLEDKNECFKNIKCERVIWLNEKVGMGNKGLMSSSNL